MRIRELILSNEFLPGKRISETVAIERIGISRVPLKLALKELEHQGLVEVLPAGGFVVNRFFPSDVHDAIEIRGILEGLAAQKLATRGVSDSQKERLEEVLKSIDATFESSSSFDEVIGNYVHLNSEFHELLLETIDSPMILRSLNHVTSLPFSSPNDFVFTGDDQEEQLKHLIIAQEQHWNVFRAILDNDAIRAEFVMREHAQLAKRNFDFAITQSPTDHNVPALALINSEKEDSRH